MPHSPSRPSTSPLPVQTSTSTSTATITQQAQKQSRSANHRMVRVSMSNHLRRSRELLVNLPAVRLEDVCPTMVSQILFCKTWRSDGWLIYGSNLFVEQPATGKLYIMLWGGVLCCYQVQTVSWRIDPEFTDKTGPQICILYPFHESKTFPLAKVDHNCPVMKRLYAHSNWRRFIRVTPLKTSINSFVAHKGMKFAIIRSVHDTR